MGSEELVSSKNSEKDRLCGEPSIWIPLFGKFVQFDNIDWDRESSQYTKLKLTNSLNYRDSLNILF